MRVLVGACRASTCPLAPLGPPGGHEEKDPGGQERHQGEALEDGGQEDHEDHQEAVASGCSAVPVVVPPDQASASPTEHSCPRRFQRLSVSLVVVAANLVGRPDGAGAHPPSAEVDPFEVRSRRGRLSRSGAARSVVVRIAAGVALFLASGAVGCYYYPPPVGAAYCPDGCCSVLLQSGDHCCCCCCLLAAGCTGWRTWRGYGGGRRRARPGASS